MVTRRVGSVLALAAAALSAVALSGCEIAAVTVASPRASIVVHAVLNPEADEQVILVESSLTGRVGIDDTVRFDPLDPIRTAGGEPLANADVRVLVDDDTVGVRATEGAIGGRSTGRYTLARSALAIAPGRRYRLRLRTADGAEVTGETRVPSSRDGWTPGSGAAVVPVSIVRSTDTLRLTWPAIADARTYAIRIETPNGPWFLFSDSAQFALAGTLRNFFADGLPSVWYPGFLQPLSVVAVDRNFYDYNRSGNDPFGGSGLISSVRGGLGLFGSVLPLLRRDVTVTDRDKVPIDARWVGMSSDDQVIEMDLWLESAGPTISSVSGRVRTTANRYVVGTLQGAQIQLTTLAGISRRDTVSVFTGRLADDVLTGSYNPRFGSGPLMWRRQARSLP